MDQWEQDLERRAAAARAAISREAARNRRWLGQRIRRALERVRAVLER